MKFTVSAVLLSTIPGALSADLEPRLRGPASVVVAASCCSGSHTDYNDTDYNDGFKEGKKNAKYYWTEHFNADCNRISDYDKMIENYIHDNYDYNGYDHGDKQYWYKQGAAKGMEEQKTYYDNHCKNNWKRPSNDHDYVSVPKCSLIGKNIASKIAVWYQEKHRNICGSHGDDDNVDKEDYGEFGNTMECVTIAEDDCKGHMDEQIKIWCNAKYDDFSVLKTLKDKCYNEVKKEIGGNSNSLN